jgi:hypothetical protein
MLVVRNIGRGILLYFVRLESFESNNCWIWICDCESERNRKGNQSKTRKNCLLKTQVRRLSSVLPLPVNAQNKKTCNYIPTNHLSCLFIYLLISKVILNFYLCFLFVLSFLKSFCISILCFRFSYVVSTSKVILYFCFAFSFSYIQKYTGRIIPSLGWFVFRPPLLPPPSAHLHLAHFVSPSLRFLSSSEAISRVI